MSRKQLFVEKILVRAKSHAQKGEIEQAQELYQIILKDFPKNRDAIKELNALSMPLKQQNAELDNNQANMLINLYKQGKLQEALNYALTLSKQFPNVPLIANLLGAVYTGLGRKKEAVAALKKALTIDPGSATTHYNLGIAFKRLDKHNKAITSFEDAIRLKPDHVDAHNNLGAALKHIGQYEKAIHSFEKALLLKPSYAEAHYHLGTIFIHLGRYDDALTSLQQAIQIKPDFTKAYRNLGIVFMHLDQPRKAADCFIKVLQKNPSDAETHCNLGAAFKNFDQDEKAMASFQAALQLKPELIDAHHNLGIILKDAGKNEDAISSFKKAVHLDKNYISAYGELLYQLEYVCDWEQLENTKKKLHSITFGSTLTETMSPFSILALIGDAKLHRKTAEAYVLANYKADLALGPLPKRQNPDRIRIGYFSADYRNHPVMYLMAELFELHDRSKFEIHAFSIGPDTQDAMRTRVQKSADAFHDVRLKRNIDIAALSRSLNIDIAVDLTGHTEHCKTGIFSYGAAPIQVNYLGYPGTMGASYFDYIIADPTLIPPDHQSFYSEKIAYLPNSYQINDCTREISNKQLSRSDAGLPEKAFVFCCFNNNYKITPDAFEIWMRLLEKVKGSVLWLLKANKFAEKNLRKAAQSHNIDPDRLIFAEHKPLPEHLARHRLADLFLDTFNYNAHTTASDALWAGLPIVTKMGESFASRVAGSLLNATEMPELITNTTQEYENLALRLANNPDELKMLTKKLKANLGTTALFDSKLYTKHLEDAFTKMVSRLNQGLPASHLYIEQ